MQKFSWCGTEYMTGKYTAAATVFIAVQATEKHRLGLTRSSSAQEFGWDTVHGSMLLQLDILAVTERGVDFSPESGAPQGRSHR